MRQKETSQKKGEPKKRWFTSLGMDLFVWLNDEDEIISYQLTYNKPHDEKALTWSGGFVTPAGVRMSEQIKESSRWESVAEWHLLNS